MALSLTPADIVRHLRTYLPRKTDLFSEYVDISPDAALWISPNKIKMPFADAINYEIGDVISVVSAAIRNQVIDVQLREDNTIAKLTTVAVHDISEPIKSADPTTIELEDFEFSEWNGSQKILSVPSNTEVEIIFSESVTPLSPVSVYGHIIEHRPTLTGLWQVIEKETVPPSITLETAYHFAYPFDYAMTDFAAAAFDRIVMAVSIKRALEAYTSTTQDANWLYVIPVTRESSRDRYANTDAIAEFTDQNLGRSMIMLDFTTLAVFNTSDTLVAEDASNIAYGELYDALIGTLFWLKHPVCSSNFVTVYDSDGMIEYNKSYYAHEYNWQFPFYITREAGFIDRKDFSAEKIIYDLRPFSLTNPDVLRAVVNLRED